MFTNALETLTCQNCPIGKYGKNKGTIECTLCEVGTYQPSERSQSCIPCSNGEMSCFYSN